MNKIDWYIERLDWRCLFYTCLLNIDGATEEVVVSLKKEGRWDQVQIERIEKPGRPVLELYLGALYKMAGDLYNFTQDNGIDAVLVIPLPDDENEDDEDE